MNKKSVISVILAGVLLAACANYENRPKEGVGTLIGAGLGALAGSQVGSGKGQLAAVAIGALGGAFLGSELGKSLDKADRLYAKQAQTKATSAPVGQTVAWNNPDSGNSGSVVAVRDGKNTNTGDYCREYKTTINVGGKSETAYGTACRQPDGTWKILK